jgi:hypothetical protein
MGLDSKDGVFSGSELTVYTITLPPLYFQKDVCGPRCGNWFFQIAFCVGLEIQT